MNRRDIELLSAYLDGQLKPADSARLESRLKTEPELVSVMDDLRATRNLLRKLPQRRAPRNFTLTRQMVGQNPPMPRAYPFFRFATTLATLLLFFTFGLNFLAPQLAASRNGGFGGGGPDLYSQQAPAAAEVPATEAPATEAPAELIPLPTATLTPTMDEMARTEVMPAEKTDEAGNDAIAQQAPQVPPLIPYLWQLGLTLIAIAGGLFMLLMRQAAYNRWRQKE
jgi:hypothetical protein